MAARRQPNYPLIVIVGPTASGKTGLAIQIAKRYGGEVISADSRAVYRGLTIGTAKPMLEEQGGIPHWGIDLVDPNERFTVADFQRYANAKIAEIRAREHIPVLVGGTGLYIDAVLYQYEFPESKNNIERRTEMETYSLDKLYSYCSKHNITLPENKKNKRYVINAILRNGQILKRKLELEKNTVVVGITTEKEILRNRIKHRVSAMINAGVVDEALNASSKYGWDSEAMTGNVYPLIRDYLEGKISHDELGLRFTTKDWQLAKRQLTWLHRSEHIYWANLDDAYTYIAHQLVEVNNL